MVGQYQTHPTVILVSLEKLGQFLGRFLVNLEKNGSVFGKVLINFKRKLVQFQERLV